MANNKKRVSGSQKQRKPVTMLGNVIQGASTVVEGVKDVVDGIKDKNIKKVGRGIGKVYSGRNQVRFNHDEWYENYPLEGLVAANFGRRVGITEKSLMNSDASENVSIPSVCRLNVINTIPNEESKSWNQAINQLYGIIRSANSGSVNYAPIQLAKYMAYVIDMYSIYFTARRAYSTLKNFNASNATEPASLFAGMGLDYSTFRDNAADLFSFLNLYGLQIRNMAPITCDLIKRKEWIFSNIFADSDDAKASKYVMSLGKVMVVGGTDIDPTEYNMSSVFSETLTSNTTGLTYPTFIDRAKKVITKFQNDSTFMVIAGDILKAFGQSALYDLHIPTDNETTPVLFDEAALSQIQNATVFGKGFNLSVSRNIGSGAVSDTISINRGLVSKTAPLGLVFSPFINTYKDSLKPSQLISATRFTLAAPADVNWTDKNNLATTNGLVNGTEVIEFGCVYYRSTGSSNFMDFVTTNIGHSIDPSGLIGDNVLAWASMDYAPMTVLQSDDNYLGTLFDWNNYARVTDSEVGTYHAYACMSLLYAPRLVKVSKTEVIK